MRESFKDSPARPKNCNLLMLRKTKQLFPTRTVYKISNILFLINRENLQLDVTHRPGILQKGHKS